MAPQDLSIATHSAELSHGGVSDDDNSEWRIVPEEILTPDLLFELAAARLTVIGYVKAEHTQNPFWLVSKTHALPAYGSAIIGVTSLESESSTLSCIVKLLEKHHILLLRFERTKSATGMLFWSKSQHSRSVLEQFIAEANRLGLESTLMGVFSDIPRYRVESPDSFPRRIALPIRRSSATKLKVHEPVPVNTPPALSPDQQRELERRGFVLASREYQNQDTEIVVGDVTIGSGGFVVIAGPCAVESYDQIMACANAVRMSGAQILRGGCFKPRTSPYSFQGLGLEGLEFLAEAGRVYELPVITEVLAPEDVPLVAEKADILQVGARNMHNFALLKAVGRTPRPVMLKRGISSSLDELLQAAEYILAQGNRRVMLCERGIRTFETSTRSTLDLSAIPVLRQRTHLPILVDPSHAAGDRQLVRPLALAAQAVGSHGVMVEIHPEPERALSDGPQALYLNQFEELMEQFNTFTSTHRRPVHGV